MTDQEPLTAAPAARSILHALHEQAGAEFQPYGPTQVVSTFGQPEAEYAAIRKGAALIDSAQRGVLELAGKDRHAFLNNLLTNQVWDKQTKTGLSPGQGLYAFFLNTKGRIVADMNVLERGDRTLLEMDGRLLAEVAAAFDKFLFAEQVRISNLAEKACVLQLHGPQSAALVDPALAALLQLGSTELMLFGVNVTAFRDDSAGVPGYGLIVPADAAAQVWTQLLALGETGDRLRLKLRPAGWAAYNATRIEAGRAIFGIDYDPTVLPAETGQFDRAVSITKGCYLGQEIVARMHARQQLARQIVGIRMIGDALPIAGAQITDEPGTIVGIVTSSTVSPVLSNAAICLAMVKKPFIALGTKLRIPAEGEIREGVVSQLPFWKTSAE
jgi:folate-binding protein YgfZ